MVAKRTARSGSAAALVVAQLMFSTATALPAEGPAATHNRETKVFTLDLPSHGNPEGIAFDADTQAFFVGSTGDGTIYNGTLGSDVAALFIDGTPGAEAAGIKAHQGKLYVAGGFTCAVRVYEIATKRLVASFQGPPGGMFNDLAVTRNGDVFVTDSFRPTLWRISAAQVAAGGGSPQAVYVGDKIPHSSSPDPWNLNGIVALRGGRRLIVVQSNSGKLFRLDLGDGAPDALNIEEIAVDEPVYGDGLVFDKGHLVAVTFSPVALTFIKLDDGMERGKVVDRRTDPTLREPSTLARARNFYLVVNPDWSAGRVPFTVSGLPRNGNEDDE